CARMTGATAWRPVKAAVSVTSSVRVQASRAKRSIEPTLVAKALETRTSTRRNAATARSTSARTAAPSPTSTASKTPAVAPAALLLAAAIAFATAGVRADDVLHPGTVGVDRPPQHVREPGARPQPPDLGDQLSLRDREQRLRRAEPPGPRVADWSAPIDHGSLDHDGWFPDGTLDFDVAWPDWIACSRR